MAEETVGSVDPEIKFDTKVVNNQIEVTVIDGGKVDTYIFRIPSVREMTRLGVRERDLRMLDSANMNGSSEGIDIVTEYLYRALALFEILLEKTSDTRLFSEEKDGKPIIDSAKFGADINPALLIGVQQGFEQALSSFRKNRA